MGLMLIGEAAIQLGMSPSTLRYYEELGLVRVERRAGRRVYGTAELRRLAFVHLVHRLGIPLATAAAILNQPSDAWRDAVAVQLAELDELISRARGAQAFLTHALACPEQHPTIGCPQMVATLDRLVAGTRFEQLATEHT